MLNAQVVVNLSPELAVRTDLGIHGDDSNAARDGSRQMLFRIAGGRSSREGTECSRERNPNKLMHMLAVRTTPGQLDRFTALVFKQRSKQATLRKGQRRFFHNDHNVIDNRIKKFRMGLWSQSEVRGWPCKQP